MIQTVVIAVIEIFVVLWCLKSGLLLSFMENVPFIGYVSEAIGSYLGFTGVNPMPPSHVFFMENMVKALIFLCIFNLIEKPMSAVCTSGIGKHEKYREIKLSVRGCFAKLLVNVASAALTALAMEYLYNQLGNALAGYEVWVKCIWGAGLVGILVILFLFLQAPLWAFCIWLVGKIIFPSVIKILCVEFLVIFLYYFLNIPGMFEQTGTMAIMIIGILCCIGSVFGIEMYESKWDSEWESSRNAKHARREFW